MQILSTSLGGTAHLKRPNLLRFASDADHAILPLVSRRATFSTRALRGTRTALLLFSALVLLSPAYICIHLAYHGSLSWTSRVHFFSL